MFYYIEGQFDEDGYLDHIKVSEFEETLENSNVYVIETAQEFLKWAAEKERVGATPHLAEIVGSLGRKSASPSLKSNRIKKLFLRSVSPWAKVYSLETAVKKLCNREIVSSPSSQVFTNLVKLVEENNYKVNETSISNESMVVSYHEQEGFNKAYRGGLTYFNGNNNLLKENVVSFDVNSMYPWAAHLPLPITHDVVMNAADYSISQEGLEGPGIEEGGSFIALIEFKGVEPLNNVGRNVDFWEFNEEGNVFGGFSQPDLETFLKLYRFEEAEVKVVSMFKLGNLPPFYTKYLNELYEAKENSTGVERELAKVEINSVVGYWGTEPVSMNYNKIIYGQSRSWDFRWAVFTTAYARLRMVNIMLEIEAAGGEVVYGDTDSLYAVGDVDKISEIFEKDNEVLAFESGLGAWEKQDVVEMCVRKKKFMGVKCSKGNTKFTLASVDNLIKTNLNEELTLEEFSELETLDLTLYRYTKLVGPLSSWGTGNQFIRLPYNFEFEIDC